MAKKVISNFFFFMTTLREENFPLLDSAFPVQGRSDDGLAKVHGKINGQFVEGDLRLRRIAHYHPQTGEWTGAAQAASQTPLETSAVSQVVADAVAEALGGISRKGYEDVPEEYRDPSDNSVQEITRATARALALQADTSSQQLRAMLPTVKTLGGCDCAAPCTRDGRDRAWCVTAAPCGRREGNLPIWDYCERSLISTVKGCRCQFPFQ